MANHGAPVAVGLVRAAVDGGRINPGVVVAHLETQVGGARGDTLAQLVETRALALNLKVALDGVRVLAPCARSVDFLLRRYLFTPSPVHRFRTKPP